MASEWKDKSLGKLFSVKHGFAFKGAHFVDKPTRHLITTPGNFVIGGGFKNTKPKYYKGPIPEDYILDAGDVVVTMTDLSKASDTLGNAAFIPKDDNIWLHNQRIGLLEFNEDEEVSPEFICYLLRSNEYRSWIVGSATGTTVKHTSPSRIAEFSCPIPPLPEQKAIAHILGSLDDKIELNRRMNETLEGMAAALFKSWFVDFDPVIDNALEAGNPIPKEFAARAKTRQQALSNNTANRQAAKHFPATFQRTKEMGWIPEGWEVTSFGDVSTCFDRKRVPLSKKQREEKKPGHIPYYGATSIMDYINEWIFDDTYLLIGEDGSVMKEDGAPFVQYIWGKTWVNNHAHVLQGASGISTEHLMLFMLSQNMTAYVTGAVQLKINQKNMNSIPFLKADAEVNKQFADCISPVYERIKQLAEEAATLTKLRDTLLPKLISGEVEIKA